MERTDSTLDAPRTTIDASPGSDPAGAFAGRLIELVADASTALLISIGHRTRLFDTLEHLPPSTADEIAEVAGLQERYVREWLGGMHVAGVVTHDRESRTWALPPEHAAHLTRSAGIDNLAKLTQMIGMLATVEERVATCFREGGGVPYEAFTEFHALMAEDSHDVAHAVLLDGVVPLVDGLADRLRTGIAVADIGCGSGHHLTVLADAFPTSSFVGYDIAEEAIAEARRRAVERGLTNLRFEVRDVTDLSGTGPFDLITAFDAIHDQAHPAAVLAGTAAALASGGVLLVADVKASSDPADNVELPWAPFLYAISLLHCMTVSLAVGGAGLGAVWGRQTATRMLHEAGYTSVRVAELDGDFFNDYFVATIV